MGQTWDKDNRKFGEPGRIFEVLSNFLLNPGNLVFGAPKEVASAAELALGRGVYFNVTGTTSITSIAAADGEPGRFVILQFAEAVTLTDGNNLQLSEDYSATADDLVFLLCDGTDWRQATKSVESAS